MPQTPMHVPSPRLVYTHTHTLWVSLSCMSPFSLDHRRHVPRHDSAFLKRSFVTRHWKETHAHASKHLGLYNSAFLRIFIQSFTTITGTEACSTTYRDTDPMKKRLKAPKPRQPTIRRSLLIPAAASHAICPMRLEDLSLSTGRSRGMMAGWRVSRSSGVASGWSLFNFSSIAFVIISPSSPTIFDIFACIASLRGFSWRSIVSSFTTFASVTPRAIS
mmetsp:Transcript_26559/g.52151  ORF Transcript_26559/g.52151 Transcript_26559/m.52151 type:complete len:218 (-) Transcript_26559:419-1072(-)